MEDTYTAELLLTDGTKAPPNAVSYPSNQVRASLAAIYAPPSTAASRGRNHVPRTHVASIALVLPVLGVDAWWSAANRPRSGPRSHCVHVDWLTTPSIRRCSVPTYLLSTYLTISYTLSVTHVNELTAGHLLLRRAAVDDADRRDTLEGGQARGDCFFVTAYGDRTDPFTAGSTARRSRRSTYLSTVHTPP